MIANADLLDYDDVDEDEENHLNYNIGNHQNMKANEFYDYQMSSKNSFGDRSDYKQVAMQQSSHKKQTSINHHQKSRHQDDEDEFLDDIINRNFVGKNKAPPAVNF